MGSTTGPEVAPGEAAATGDDVHVNVTPWRAARASDRFCHPHVVALAVAGEVPDVPSCPWRCINGAALAPLDTHGQ